MRVLKTLFDLSLAVHNCKTISLDKKIVDALDTLEVAQANFEKVVLSQRLDENEKVPNHLGLQKPSQVSTPHGTAS